MSGNGAARPVWRDLSSDSDEGYIDTEWFPKHLIDLCDWTPRTVLDVGCFAGATGRHVKARWPEARLIGIEPRARAARIAAERMDHVQLCTLEAFSPAFAGVAPGTVDTVILADVLEHMYDPWGALVDLHRLLAPDARLLVSIPNVRNIWLMSELARGNWTYESIGLLDITHIRFFTLSGVRRLFQETGYTVGRVNHVLDKRCRSILEGPDGGPAAFEGVTVQRATRADRVELATLQFFFVAQAAGRPG